MPLPTPPTSLTITNPLVLYRTLVATRRIEPDPAQHRLALHLQKLYARLIDYRPEVDFNHRIRQINRLTRGKCPVAIQDGGQDASAQGWKWMGSGREDRSKTEALALTKRLTDHESALQIQSPQGLLLYGEVGTGKSLLVDLLADSLPNAKKRRWHFNTFMLETLANLESIRKDRLSPVTSSLGGIEEHSLLWIARDMISTSPILFLDEFQLPDRTASKILSSLLTSFFHLGGVLIATSNRMPEELANASGVEFAQPPKPGLFGNRWPILGSKSSSRNAQSPYSGKGDFVAFLEVLKARCETWDMEGGRDWRRRDVEIDEKADSLVRDADAPGSEVSFGGLEPMAAGNIGLGYEQSASTNATERDKGLGDSRLPSKYFIPSLSNTETRHDDWENHKVLPIQAYQGDSQEMTIKDIPWESTDLMVYGRSLHVPRQYQGISRWTFEELCFKTLGPADYITLASNFHTFILTDVPILTIFQKNEARRFITLLDASYEARCKLLVSAEAAPDDLFFPERAAAAAIPGDAIDQSDGVYSETFAEIYQDANDPFRPNISAYKPSASTPNYVPDLPSPFRSSRSILADEDSDFGPTYGAGRSRGLSDGEPGSGHEIGHQAPQPDFTKTGAYTGEDERFAYKRARSRLWEMCGKRWWDRQEEGWWKPLSKEARRWERTREPGPGSPGSELKDVEIVHDEALFRHGASPFRTSQDPPPRFSLVHAWGMMKWGKKAGAWGQGTEGLQKQRTEKEGK